MKTYTYTLFVLCAGILIAGCSKSTTASQPVAAKKETTMSAQKAPEAATKSKNQVSEPTASTIDATKTYSAVIKTSKGDIAVDLYAAEAPLSVSNFVQMAETGFYEGLTFHRVEPGFVIQGGDPAGNGTGGPGYTVKAEIGKKHIKGALAWARTGDNINPERRSSGSQFYITLEATPFLDGQYTVFGLTTEGMDVVAKIGVGDTIDKVVITAQ
jgi:cyclophilin family peptidyl-prolyl cis-trans isomerase